MNTAWKLKGMSYLETEIFVVNGGFEGFAIIYTGNATRRGR